jgi:hypothetical protein
MESFREFKDRLDEISLSQIGKGTFGRTPSISTQSADALETVLQGFMELLAFKPAKVFMFLKTNSNDPKIHAIDPETFNDPALKSRVRQASRKVAQGLAKTETEPPTTEF